MIWNFNYDKAIHQAEQLESIADEICNLANNRMGDIISSVRASWSGETSSIFRLHCEVTKNRILAKAQEVTQTAARIRSVAKILRDAEENARRQMEELSRRTIGG